MAAGDASSHTMTDAIREVPGSASARIPCAADGRRGAHAWLGWRMAVMASLAMGAVLSSFGQQVSPASSGVPVDQTTADSVPVEKIEVTGIAVSRQKALDAKRAADSLTEVISAEDIGKLPDKNVADALERLPGVNTSSQAGGEGGFDENDRVSMRGTGPSLTQVTINGHAVSSGDWFIQDQFQTVGRSASLTLLPSEMVDRIVVNKGQRADQTEGGIAGNIDIQTRKALDFSNQIGAAIDLGGVYSDLPNKTEPQMSALVHFKNDANTFGALIQVFDESRDLRRDGQEILGYETISAGSPAARAYPVLANAIVPSLIGSALFEQERERRGGDFDLEARPDERLTLDLNGFYSHMDASNFNRNFLAWTGNLANSQVPTSFTLRNDMVTAASFANQSTDRSALIDNIYRPGEYAQSQYVDFDASFSFNDHLKLSTQLGNTQGLGVTPSQPAYEGQIFTGLSYNMNGISQPAAVSFPGGNPASFNGVSTSNAWNESVRSIDKENYFQADALYFADWGVLDGLKFGVRVADHSHLVLFPLDGACVSGCGAVGTPANAVPVWGGATYPANFGSGLDPPGGFLSNPWQLSPAAITSFVAAHVSSGPSRLYWPGESDIRETDSAAYAMSTFGGSQWAGDLGIRLVNTAETSVVNVSGGVDPITSSAYGPYSPTAVSHTYLDVLPSANLAYELTSDTVLRGYVNMAMARPDYSAWSGAVSLNDLLETGTGGNPNLKPIRSTNYDLSWEYYFAPKSLFSASVFYMDLSSYVSFNTSSADYYNQFYHKVTTYSITSPSNIAGTVEGYELAATEPLAGGFGVEANFTYANASASGGSPLVGASRDTYNVSGYFENSAWSVRLAYSYRSDFLVGLDRSFVENEAGVGTLALSINYSLTKQLSLNFNALNLNDAQLRYYGNNTMQPRAFYSSGRQYYFGMRADF